MCDIKEYGTLEIMGKLHNSAATSRDRTQISQRMVGGGPRCSLTTQDYRRILPHSFSQLSTTLVPVMSTISHFLPISVFKCDAMYSGGWVGRQVPIFWRNLLPLFRVEGAPICQYLSARLDAVKTQMIIFQLRMNYSELPLF